VVKVFLTLLAKKDADDVYHGTAYTLARQANKTEPEVLEALHVLAGPDCRRTEPQDFDDRKLQAVEGGWLVLNAQKYREIISKQMKRSVIGELQRRTASERSRARDQGDGAGNCPRKRSRVAEAERHQWQRPMGRWPGSRALGPRDPWEARKEGIHWTMEMTTLTFRSEETEQHQSRAKTNQGQRRGFGDCSVEVDWRVTKAGQRGWRQTLKTTSGITLKTEDCHHELGKPVALAWSKDTPEAVFETSTVTHAVSKGLTPTIV